MPFSSTSLPGAHGGHWLCHLAFWAGLIASGATHAQVPLQTATTFAVLGASTVTSTGGTSVTGNVGVSPGTSVTGFPPGTVVPPASIHAGDAVAVQAQADLATAYNSLSGLPFTTDLTGQGLGGLTLLPGTYRFASSAALGGTLTLDAQGDPGAVFNFQIGSTLTTASLSAVNVINGGSACSVYWQVGSSATLGIGTAFAGNILANISITATTGVTVSGRLLARNGAVTLDTNNVAICSLPQPVLTTTASPSGMLATTISDSATLAGAVSPTGRIDFSLFGPDDLLCSGLPAFTSSAVVNGNGIYGSGSVTPGSAGTWRWVASYSGDAGNSPVVGACNAPNESVTITPALTALSTAASGPVMVGGLISDTATLTGGVNPTGTITFRLFAPGDLACATPIGQSIVPIAGNGAYVSASFSASIAGIYRWIANYDGDTNNSPTLNACNAAGETVHVLQAVPTVVTTPSPTIMLGGAVSDTALLSGGANPTGSITFRLFGPNDTACTAAVYSTSIPVAGNGTYGSGSYIPSVAGVYRWVASYSGDASNGAVTSACNTPGETVVVSPANPVVITVASSGGSLGVAIQDTAIITGGIAPSGVMVFHLYGPGDVSCTGAVAFNVAVQVAGNGSYDSGPYTPVAAGTYRWTATYSGDTSNATVSGVCNAPNENAVITLATPALLTTASAGVTRGGAVTDSALLSGGINPTGSILFQLYGPDDSDCVRVPVFTTITAVTGNGSYSSARFTPVAAGLYRWTASYAGDANNAPTTGLCNLANESVIVARSVSAIVSTASPGVMLGAAIADTGILATGPGATGTITFRVYGPADATCANPPLFVSTLPVSGAGTYASGTFTPVLAGIYRWIADYSGDSDNSAALNSCNAMSEAVTVSAPGSAVTTLGSIATPSATLGSTISDVALLQGGTSPTGTISFLAYGPDDAACAASPVFMSSISANGNGSYESGPYTPRVAGVYRWIANYGGDVENVGTSNACNAPDEVSVITAVVVVEPIPVLGNTALLLTGLAIVLCAFRVHRSSAASRAWKR